MNSRAEQWASPFVKLRQDALWGIINDWDSPPSRCPHRRIVILYFVDFLMLNKIVWSCAVRNSWFFVVGLHRDHRIWRMLSRWPVCSVRCSLRFDAAPNFLRQNSHSNGRSPVWTLNRKSIIFRILANNILRAQYCWPPCSFFLYFLHEMNSSFRLQLYA